MSKEEINIAIAAACGWAHPSVQPYAFPDFCNDLNAMHEAEKTLKLGMRSRYDAELFMLAERDHCFIWEATARQRAEAFLKTIGKWEEMRRIQP